MPARPLTPPTRRAAGARPRIWCRSWPGTCSPPEPAAPWLPEALGELRPDPDPLAEDQALLIVQAAVWRLKDLARSTYEAATLVEEAIDLAAQSTRARRRVLEEAAAAAAAYPATRPPAADEAPGC